METTTPALEQSSRIIHRIPIAQLSPGPLAMRTAMGEEQLQDLMLSMSRVGQQNPITVHVEAEQYVLITGHRRTAAAQALGWTHIDGIIEHRDNPTLWALAWSENYARADVSLVDQADWLDRMRSQNGWTQAQLAAVVGMGESAVSDILAILRYPEPLREALDAAAVSLGVARALNRLDDAAIMVYYLAQACEHGCTARQAEEWVRNYKLSQMPRQEDVDELVDQPHDYVPAPTLVSTCAACQTTSPGGLLHVPVCPGCYALITNPPQQ